MEAGIRIICWNGFGKPLQVASLLIILLFLHRGSCNTSTKNLTQTAQTINEIRGIPKDYNINDPPIPSVGRPVDVNISVTIFDIRDIYVNGELSIEVNIKTSWKDERLRHMANNWNYAVLKPQLIDQMWHPDIYIDHVKKVDSPKLMSLPAYLRIYNDSKIVYSARLTIGMSCQMEFRHYPADTQRCDIDMKSYAYLDDSLKLSWDDKKEASLKEGLTLPNYEVALGLTDYFTIITSAGHYTGLRFTIVLKRKLSFHIIQTYIPSALFVVISWLSFLVSPEMVPGRMTLCMTTLLTLIAMFGAIRQNSPIVSYVKGLDIWMVTCVFFVFLTLLEYTAVLKLRSLKPTDPDKPGCIDYAKLAANLETYCSKLIPFLFVVFIFTYWPWLLIASNYYDEKEFLETKWEP